MDVTPEAIREKRAFIYINKELQRVKKKVIERLDGKGVLLTFPSENKLCSTVRVLKVPKTETSIRRVYIPEFIADLFIAWKKEQDDLKKLMGKEYHDYGLVFATNTGFPTGDSSIRKHFKKLIRNHALPKVDFHSLRHTSVTYKLKLTGGDIKSVQGDSGHAQVDMVTDVYSHIMDEDRRKIAGLLQEAFYEKKNLNPQIHNTLEGTMMALPEGFDAELLAKALSNSEMAALLMSIIKGMQK